MSDECKIQYNVIFKAKEIAGQLKGGGKGKGAQGNPKPLYGEICEQVKILSDQGNNIPITTLAKLIKFKLISLKTKEKERNENEKKVSLIILFISKKFHIDWIKSFIIFFNTIKVL